MLECCIVRQNQESFAICIETAGGVHIRGERTELLERLDAGFPRKLGENAVWLIEEDVVKCLRLVLDHNGYQCTTRAG